MRPDHAHPSFSPDGARLLIQSGLLTDGARLSLIVVHTGMEAPSPDSLLGADER
jgi:hypothetical protein